MLEQEGSGTVSAPDRTIPGGSSSWIVPVVRAAFALIATIAITFSSDHSAGYGLLVFGIWSIVTGLVVGTLQLRVERSNVERWLFGVIAVATVAAGILALTIPASLGLLLVLVSSWAAVTGFTELFIGMRQRGREPLARDRMFAGVLTALLGLLLVLLPPNSVVGVGLIGAYFAILGVYLAIGGFSVKAARSPAASRHTPLSETDAP